MSTRIVVVGGGISGLAAAQRLRILLPDAAITLCEREPRLGGKIRTERTDGFVIEGGPDSFLAAKPRGIGLSEELGLATRLIGPDTRHRRTFVLREGRLHRLPEGLTGLIPTSLGPMAKTRLISPRGKGRMALDFVLPPRRGDDDESLASFIERRLGSEVYLNLIEPLMAGIYAGDGRALSLRATFPQLRHAEKEHGGLIKGVLAARKAAPPPVAGQPRGFLSYPTGLAELVEALAAALTARGVDIRAGTAIGALEPAGDGYRVSLQGGEPLDAEAVIVATEAWAAPDLLAPVDSGIAATLRTVPHVSSAIVVLAFRTAELPGPLDGYGYVVPRNANRPVMATTWLSSKWPGRAPADMTLVRGFVGRAGQEDILDRTDERLTDLLRGELSTVLGITAAPVLSRVVRWDRGMPQYTLGHPDRVAAVEQALARHPRLAIAGNAFQGVGIPDCILSGERAAARIADGLRRQAKSAVAAHHGDGLGLAEAS